MAFLLQYTEHRRSFLADCLPEAVRAHLSSDRYRSHVTQTDGNLIGMEGNRDHEHFFHLFVAEEVQRQRLPQRLLADPRPTSCACSRFPACFTVAVSATRTLKPSMCCASLSRTMRLRPASRSPTTRMALSTAPDQLVRIPKWRVPLDQGRPTTDLSEPSSPTSGLPMRRGGGLQDECGQAPR